MSSSATMVKLLCLRSLTHLIEGTYVVVFQHAETRHLAAAWYMETSRNGLGEQKDVEA